MPGQAGLDGDRNPEAPAALDPPLPTARRAAGCEHLIPAVDVFPTRPALAAGIRQLLRRPEPDRRRVPRPFRPAAVPIAAQTRGTAPLSPWYRLGAGRPPGRRPSQHCESGPVDLG